MNYIELIEKQAVQLRKQGIISTAEFGAYVLIVSTANGFRWKNPFSATNQYFMWVIGCDEKTFIRIRNKLKQVGLLDFVSGKKGQPTKYTLIDWKISSEKAATKLYSDNWKFSSESASTNDSEYASESISQVIENKQVAGASKLNKTKLNKTEDSSHPKRTVSRKEIELSESAQKFAQWFRGLLPPDRDTNERDLQSWAKTYDELVTIDKRDKAEIFAVVKFARQDSFWQANFLSATKLRHKDKTGTKYYDVFLNRMKAGHDANTGTNGRGANGQTLTPYQQRQHNGQRSVATLVENARDFAASLT